MPHAQGVVWQLAASELGISVPLFSVVSVLPVSSPGEKGDSHLSRGRPDRQDPLRPIPLHHATLHRLRHVRRQLETFHRASIELMIGDFIWTIFDVLDNGRSSEEMVLIVRR